MNSSALLLRRSRWTSLAEGATLILLVCVAVLLKRMAGLFSALETLRLLVVAFVAFVPFGAFFMTGLFRRKAAALSLV
jgi:hypothetical protein